MSSCKILREQGSRFHQSELVMVFSLVSVYWVFSFSGAVNLQILALGRILDESELP